MASRNRKSIICVLAIAAAALMALMLCACGRSTSGGKQPVDLTVPEFGEYTGLTKFLDGAANDPVVRIIYRPGTMGSDSELYVTDAKQVDEIVDGLKNVKIFGVTYSMVTDWYPSITLETESGASLSLYFNGEWLEGRQVNYTLVGMKSVWNLIKENASEPEPLQCGDFLYELLEDGSAIITYYIGNGGKVEIPETLDGNPVTSIGYDAFHGMDEINEIIFPYAINRIKRQAFAYCDGLTRLEINCGDMVIESDAFEYCDALREIVISGEKVCIEREAFHYCKVLRRIEFNVTDLTIANDAFEYCRGLIEVNLSGTQSAEIKKEAFDYCENASFIVSEGSDAEAFCIDNQLPYTHP